MNATLEDTSLQLPRVALPRTTLAAWVLLLCAGSGWVIGSSPSTLSAPLVAKRQPVEAQPASAVRPAPTSRGPRQSRPVLPTADGPSYPYYKQIQAVAKKHRVAPELIAGIVRIESNFDRYCVSPVGAVGLMQLMPSTARGVARSMGLSHYDLYDPETNLELGTRYMTMLLSEFDGHIPTALSFYNAGRRGIVSRGVYRNRRYIRIVMDNYWDYVRNQPEAIAGRRF
ncbi:MAG TPA: lytic transglycosylase domain-containing protein [Pantanalinema sp.]